MACYCCENVRHRGRLVRVTFRYGSFQSAVVIKGKPLPGAGLCWDYEDCWKSPQVRRITCKIMHILRRQGLVNRRDGLTACRTCTI